MSTLPSRNRRFDLYQDSKLRRALDAQRLLEAIRRDMQDPVPRGTLSVRPVRIGKRLRYRLEYANPAMSCNRITFLTPGELERLHSIVGEAGDRPLLDERQDEAS